jgi:hypothetical protein
MRDFWAPAYSDILMTMLHDPVYRASSPTIRKRRFQATA